MSAIEQVETPVIPNEGDRALIGGPLELRATDVDGHLGVLEGYLSVFNEWTEIDSALEGHFLERVAPGSFKKTFAERAGRIRCIFHHGNDPSVGVRVLGPVEVLEEQEAGAYAEVPLLDTSYNRDLVPGIRAGLYGMSFRFKAIRQSVNRNPKRSAWNPKGLVERTLQELAVPEFGPTPFAAYAGAQAGMRSITDDVTAYRLALRDPEALRAGLAVAIPKALQPEAAESAAEDDTVECTDCGAMNADDAVYCDQCGVKLSDPGGEPYAAGPDETMQCPECDSMNDSDAVYCDQCGAELEADAADEDEDAAADAPEDAESAHAKAPVTTGATRAAVGLPRSRVVTESLYQRSLTVTALHPWACEEASLQVILALINERAAGEWPSREEVMLRLGIRSEEMTAEEKSPVAIIRAFGPIMPRSSMMSEVSGLTSVSSLSSQFKAAMEDDDIGTVLFNFDSPGGSSAMIPEFAAEIMAARGTKPIIAVANTLCASAAFWLAAMCDEIVGSPSADIGSVGVYSTHYDNTAARKQMGQKVTIVKSAGSPFKAEFSSDVKLSDTAEAEMQRRVDAVYDDFVAAVAEGRGTTTEDVRENYGQGRVLTARDALAAGMVDRIATFDQVLTQLRDGATAPQTSAEKPQPAAVTSHPQTTAADIDPITLKRKETPSWVL